MAFKSVSTVIFIFVFTTFSSTVISRERITKSYPECSGTGIPHTVSPCIWHMVEEFYGEGERILAEQACGDWQLKVAGIDGNCSWSGWHQWPVCSGNPDCTSLHYWFGVFHYSGCPEGTILDREKGCIPIEEDEGECDENGTKTGKSINTATGNEYHKEVIEIGNGLDISLSYNSHIRYDEYGKLDYNHLAPGWTMSFNMYVSPIYTVNNQEYVVVHRGNGRYITFNKIGSQWIAPIKDKGYKLEKTATGWRFINKYNQIETYEDDGDLETVENNNNSLSVTRVSSVIDRT